MWPNGHPSQFGHRTTVESAITCNQLQGFNQDIRFDGASIPRPFWAILSPTGLLLIPGLLHDYGHKYDQLWTKGANNKILEFKKGKGKSYWDGLFLEVGKQVNGFAAIDRIAWFGVKIGGGGAWKKHRTMNETPQKPVL